LAVALFESWRRLDESPQSWNTGGGTGCRRASRFVRRRRSRSPRMQTIVTAKA